jgi:tRNA(fMet)-specific endonuclease VapC
MAFMLDTNILSAMVRDPRGKVARKVEETRVRTVQTSVVCAGELRFGAVKLGSKDLNGRIEGLLATFEVLPLTVPADRHYAEIRAHLEKRGTLIGANDLLIAAHALATDSVLVTDNEREFSRVPGLKIENWLRPGDQEA